MEKTLEKNSDISTEGDIEELFSPKYSVDLLCDVVKPYTGWATNDYSTKTLVTFLGFKWRDQYPSVALSIELYHY